jgi:GWxTD domain-containing protein
MVRNTALMLAAVAGLSSPVPSSQTGDEDLAVRVIRFYRAEHDRTHIKGLVQIPVEALLPAPATASSLSYTVEVRVTDSTGLTLHQQSWRSRAPMPAGGLAASEAFTVEIVDFAVAPGRYRLEIAVVDSLSGHRAAASRDVQALTRDDPVSDLLIAPEIRAVAPEDTIPRPGEFRAGNNLVTAAARVRLTPLRTKVFYLLEAYSETGTTGTMNVVVHDSAGKVTVRTPEMPVTVAAGGSMVKGQVDLAGLPEGDYRLVAALSLGGRKVERSAPLIMAGLRETLVRDSARRAVDQVTDAGYFAAMREEELDDAQAPLHQIAESRELSAWDDEISVAAKRRLLIAFWQRRDPTPETAKNEWREGFYQAIAYANRTFREGGRSAKPGWKTDRGRIYAKNGTPNDVLRRQQEGRAPAYEVWSYSKGKGLYYIFADRTGFGTYALIHSNDLSETGLPGWGDIIGRPAISDASRFLGQDLLQGGRVF